MMIPLLANQDLTPTLGINGHLVDRDRNIKPFFMSKL